MAIATHVLPLPNAQKLTGILPVSQIVTYFPQAGKRQNKAKYPFPIGPGIYYWWFDEYATKHILAQFAGTNIDTDKIETQVINGQTYSCLYVGISIDLAARFKWHTVQKHTPGAVKAGTISTLRHTLGALLGKHGLESEQPVSQFMVDHCYLEWQGTADHRVAQQAEEAALSAQSGRVYPLNIQENRTIPEAAKQRLKALRTQFK